MTQCKNTENCIIKTVDKIMMDCQFTGCIDVVIDAEYFSDAEWIQELKIYHNFVNLFIRFSLSAFLQLEHSCTELSI